MDPPQHPNLGDQAQLMCTYKWLARNYPDYKVYDLPILRNTLNISRYSYMLLCAIYALSCLLVLKVMVRKSDLFFGHSGYFFVDHHDGWKLFQEILDMFPQNKMIILPQTINFYTPFILDFAKKKFSNRKNLVLLCRDEKSYDNAKLWFPGTSVMLYPDIVTSLVGSYPASSYKDGIIFVMRNDVEAFYSKQEINKLKQKFGNIRIEEIDTMLTTENWTKVARHREKYIYDTIKKISTYKVAITDRYHGTIFSAIATTPVIVVSSADHKLSSGVKWFEKAGLSKNVMYVKSLEDAYDKASEILNDNYYIEANTYFKDEYWDKLGEKLNNIKHVIF
jgi:exopolysaccharide biosynthesis predicted pyruvyltransferase EpsI